MIPPYDDLIRLTKFQAVLLLGHWAKEVVAASQFPAVFGCDTALPIPVEQEEARRRRRRSVLNLINTLGSTLNKESWKAEAIWCCSSLHGMLVGTGKIKKIDDSIKWARGEGLNPVWHTSNVEKLAHSALQNQDLSLAPIIADALEDGGCDNMGYLLNLRGSPTLADWVFHKSYQSPQGE